MALLYYKSPTDGAWVPFGTSDPVADEVQIVATTPPADLLADLWIDPAGTGTDVDWVQYDARYIQKSGDTLTGDLTLFRDPSTNMHAATKQYVDSKITVVTNASISAHMPVGSITLFAGKFVPSGWYRCDGSVHGSWALQNALESPNTPNLTAASGMSYIVYGGT